MRDDGVVTKRGVTVSGASVRLSIPGEAGYLRVARMAASSVASLAGFDLEAVDDLRIAVDELCSILIREGDGTAIDLGFRISDSCIQVDGRTRAGRRDGPLPDGHRELGEQILAVVTDHYRLSNVGGDLVFELEKRGESAPWS
jgi:serine/threonine-protein kinase RsbW